MNRSSVSHKTTSNSPIYLKEESLRENGRKLGNRKSNLKK